MPLWDKLKQELDRAGRAAQGAYDEGRARLEIFRVRQLADKAAQTLGYAVYRARASGGELDTESYRRLALVVEGHEAEATRLERQLAEMTGKSPTASTGTSGQPGGEAGADMPPVNPS